MSWYWNSGLQGLSCSPVVPPSLSAHECETARSTSHSLATRPFHLAAHLTPPTSLDECFSFKSLVVRLPHSSIFCQFWWVFVFKFVVVLLFVQGGTMYLPTPPSWPEVPHFLYPFISWWTFGMLLLFGYYE